MKKSLIILIIIILVSGCSDGLKEENNKNGSANTEKEKSETITLSRESQERINLTTEVVTEEGYNGQLKIPALIVSDPNFEAQAGPIVAGRVKKVFVSVGSVVSAGQTLMLIEGLEIGTLKGDFLKAKTMLDFSKGEYDRQKSLSEQNVGSQKNLYSAKADFDEALAEFNAINTKIHSIGLKEDDILNSNNDHNTASDLAVKSPISGTVVERNVVVGQYAESSFIAFRILNTKSLFVDGQIYENDFNKLKNNGSAEFRTPSLPNEVFSCDITYKGQIIDEKTRTIKIRAKVNNNGNKLLPQMFGDLLIKSADDRKCLLVPSASVFHDNGQNFVFIMENDSTFRKAEIKTGVELEDKVEIISGLDEGTKVVTNGVFELKSELLKESFGESE